MEYRILEINVLSANDLKNANLFTKMDAYAVVSLSGDPQLGHQKFKTNVDRQGGTNPSWNFPVKFRIDESAAKQNRLAITFTIRCDRALGDKDVGTVVVPVKELYDGVAEADGGKMSSSAPAPAAQMKSVTYQVRKPSGKPKGELRFSYKFGETENYPATAAVPVAYPVGTSAGYPPPPPPAYAYPAQQQPGYGYGYGGYPPPPPLPQPGYGYPPPGYGYPPQPQQPQNRNNRGLGLGAGLLGGVLGGLLIGDLVSDAGGFDDGGFGDGFGF